MRQGREGRKRGLNCRRGKETERNKTGKWACRKGGERNKEIQEGSQTGQRKEEKERREGSERGGEE